MDLKIYRPTVVLTLSTWEDKNKIFLELTPAYENAAKGVPKAGEKKFDYDKTIRISFLPLDMLCTAFKLHSLAIGNDLKIEKFADMAKSTNSASNDKKLLTIQPANTGGVYVNLTFGDKKASIKLNNDEVYAMAEWFKAYANKFFLKDTKPPEEEA